MSVGRGIEVVINRVRRDETRIKSATEPNRRRAKQLEHTCRWVESHETQADVVGVLVELCVSSINNVDGHFEGE